MNVEPYNVNTLTRQFNCSLNPTAQLDKIVNDANLPNFTLEVNNSGYNVNIRYNSGTYAKVVKPTILTLDNGFSAISQNFICKFDSKLPGADQNGLDFNDIVVITIHNISTPRVLAASPATTPPGMFGSSAHIC